ncbi:MAG: hypothetical protein CVV41_10820 [Candidatus Riflebacteria bacterium HGW-Riflebacteria-1]|nr:MAG: hypothetical protein CVV41_10820 [Candidatus Riflebacteria bacterium HGW-Riflebacteria-1]
MNLFFATPEKASSHELNQQTTLVGSDAALRTLLECSNDLLLVLNDKRQALIANQETLDHFGLADNNDLAGRRPGELLGCVNSSSMMGCGASPWCRSCQINLAILECLRDDTRVSENATVCVNHPKGPQSRCFQVRCIPYRSDNQRLVLTSLTETTRWRNLETLEHYFITDFSHAVTSIDCQTRMARNSRHEDLAGVLSDLERRALLLESDIRLHRFLLGHTNERYVRRPSEILLNEVIELAIDSIAESPFIVGKSLERAKKASDTRIYLDWEILVRVLQNMLLNAFEHTDPGRSVRFEVSCEDKDTISFNVWNHRQVIEQMRLRIFQRHFSSRRDSGRGLGTYAIKLLSEGFLNGQVSFDTADSGTTFLLTLHLR